MTEKLFHKNPYLREASAVIENIEYRGRNVRLVLDRTIFYPEGGGQPSDRGLIEGEGFTIEVTKVKERGEIWHEGIIKGRIPKKGEKVKLKLDWEWRYENMKNHTGQHILSAVLKRLYNLDTTGFQIFGHYNKIEVNGELDWEAITRAEIEANRIVSEGLPVTVEEFRHLPDDVAKTLRKPVTKATDRVRIVSIGKVDRTPCGGTHVRNTSEVGLIKVLRFYKKSKRTWRIEFTCGNRAIRTLNELLEDYWNALNEMPNKNRPLLERIRELKRKIDSLEKKIDELRHELWRWKGLALVGKAEKIGSYNVVALVENWPMKDAQAFAVNFVEEKPGSILLIASENYVLFARNEKVKVSMKELLQLVIEELGGKGGGTSSLARGRIDAEPEDVLNAAKEKLRKLISG
ncbi:alanyl-tRNA editing protein [Thermococcus sp.]